MATSEDARLDLLAAARHALGDMPAATLMALLPPAGIEFATRADLDARTDLLRGEMQRGFVAVRSEIGGVRGELGDLRGELAELRGEVGRGIGQLRGELGDLRGELGELRGELGEVRGELGEVRGEVGRDIGQLRGEIGDLRGDILGQTRIWLVSLVGLFAALSAAMIAAVQVAG